MKEATTPLDRLCRTMGVDREYRAGGTLHRSPDHSVLAALQALGTPMDSPEDALAALRECESRRRARLLEPVTVIWSGAAFRVPLTDHAVGEVVHVHLRREDGANDSWDVPAAEAVRDGIPLPSDLSEGYHDLTVRAGGREATTRVIRAPRGTWDGPLEGGGGSGGRGSARGWAAFLPLHALRTGRDWGTGDLTDLAALMSWIRERGGEAVATLPLLAGFLDGMNGRGPFDPSPYAPVSRHFWNELYLDPEAVTQRAVETGLLDARSAREALGAPDLRGEVQRLRKLERVDHRGAMAAKRRALAPLAAAAAERLDDLPTPIDHFLRGRPDAISYARFRATTEARGAPWQEWPAALRNAPLEGRALSGETVLETAVAHHLVAQWAMDEQLRALGTEELYLDLPLGCHANGYDVWSQRDLFAVGFSGGAPPDTFFAGGQDWGFPPLHPVASRERGHSYWIRSLQHLMSVCGTLRIDHVMSLFRLFWVPAGGTAADGVYVRYPSEELWAILCLESRRHEVEVVGEDLGTVPPEVPAAMKEHRARRTWVLPFNVGGEGYSPPPLRSVASIETHDMPTFAAHWLGLDIDSRAAAGRLSPDAVPGERMERARWCRAVQDVLEERGLVEADPSPAPSPDHGAPSELAAAEALKGLLLLLASSDTRLVVVSLEDLWLETEPQNTPGTTGSNSWTSRARLTLEEMRQDTRIVRLLDAIRDERRRSTPDFSE